MLPASLPTPPPDLLEDYANPDLSLIDIAKKRGLSLPDLATLIARPDIQERLASLESAAAQRVRSAASLHLTTAIRALAEHVDHYNARSARNDLPTNPDDRHRVTEAARKASSTLVRLARFVPVRHAPNQTDARPPQPHRHAPRFTNAEPATGASEPLAFSAPRTIVDGLVPAPTLSPARIADLVTRALSTGKTPVERTAPLLALLDERATLNGAQLPESANSAASLLASLATSTLAPTAIPQPVISGATAHISRTFSSPRGQYTLQLKLTRRTNSAHSNCWLISSIKFRPPDRAV